MVEKYKKVILDYCKTHDGTSFAELNRVFGEAGLDYKGDIFISLADYENVIIWYGWSDDAVTAFHELFGDKIMLEPCPPFVYFLDGMVPGYPLAKRAQSYKTPHWTPYWIQMKKD